jgi:hypothetical protein
MKIRCGSLDLPLQSRKNNGATRSPMFMAAFTFVLLYSSAIALSAQTFTTLANFGDYSGHYPGPLVQGIDGNFYGVANEGSTGYAYGTVFRVTPQGTLTTL